MLLATGYKAENIREYNYFDKETKLLDFAGMTNDLEVSKFHLQCIKFNPMSACMMYSVRHDFCPSGAYKMYWVCQTPSTPETT